MQLSGTAATSADFSHSDAGCTFNLNILQSEYALDWAEIIAYLERGEQNTAIEPFWTVLSHR